MVSATKEYVVDSSHGIHPPVVTIPNSFQRIQSFKELAANLELPCQGGARGARSALPWRECLPTSLCTFALSDPNPVSGASRSKGFAVPL